MKLATLRSDSRDGLLCVVNTALTKAVKADHIALNLQSALDQWSECQPQLAELAAQLNEGQCAQAFDFDATKVAAPLPRAYQWIDGSAYVNHIELVRKARGAEMPQEFWVDPLMYQGGSDHMIGAQDPIEVGSEADGIDFEAEIAVVTDDVPMGIKVDQAGKHIQLVIILNDVSLRNLISKEIAKGFGFFNSKPATAFSPVVVTVDELGHDWDGKKL
ncbi:MAG: fumarylacetoacetate hydrolase family protein, partial [Gammaproteobacteria bacterium]